MKNLIVIVLATTCFASSAFAERLFICDGQNQVAQLKISDPLIKNGSYDECNGGVGDDMTNCRTHNYQIQVRDVFIALKVNGDTLYSKMTLDDSESTINGFDIVIYKDNAIHLNLKGDKNNPILNLKFLAKGTRGNPVEIGNYSLSCK